MEFYSKKGKDLFNKLNKQLEPFNNGSMVSYYLKNISMVEINHLSYVIDKKDTVQIDLDKTDFNSLYLTINGNTLMINYKDIKSLEIYKRD